MIIHNESWTTVDRADLCILVATCSSENQMIISSSSEPSVVNMLNYGGLTCTFQPLPSGHVTHLAFLFTCRALCGEKTGPQITYTFEMRRRNPVVFLRHYFWVQTQENICAAVNNPLKKGGGGVQGVNVQGRLEPPVTVIMLSPEVSGASRHLLGCASESSLRSSRFL